MNINQHNIIDETIQEIKEKRTIEFHNVKGNKLTVKSKDRCFVSDHTFDLFEINCIEHKNNEVFITFKLLI